MSDPQLDAQGRSGECVAKKRKRNDQTDFIVPPAFWDSLSTKYLTKAALRELDRRNSLTTNSFTPVNHQPHCVLPEMRARLCSSSTSYLRNCGPRILRSIKRIARHGGPDLSDIKDHPEPLNPVCLSMDPSSSSQAPKQNTGPNPNSKIISTTNNTKSTGPYDRNFEQKLLDGGVYPNRYQYPDGRIPPPPKNFDDINERLTRPRASLSSTGFRDEDFIKFSNADEFAKKENQVMSSVLPIIEGHVRDPRCVSGGLPFNNLAPLTDGTLVPGNPDIYYGARPEQLSRKVREDLSHQIIPSTQHDLPIIPNFYVAAKGPDGSLAVASRQARYDGALGARAMHALKSYGEKAEYDGNAYTISSVYHGGQLKLYTSHCVQSSGNTGHGDNAPEDITGHGDGTPEDITGYEEDEAPGDLTGYGGNAPEYLMTQLNTWAMTGNRESCRQGITAYRNARDWAKEQRDEAIRLANEQAKR